MALLYITSIIFISSVSGLLPQLLTGTQTQAKQCFFNGHFYPPGSVLNAGRSGTWCFGAYCGFDGMIKFWDDYKCAQTNNNNPPFPDLSVLLQNAGVQSPSTTPTTTTTTTTTTTPAPTPRPTLFPYTMTTPSYQATTTRQSFTQFGCFARGRIYWPGEDITNFRRGRRCAGSYCDWQSQIQHWEDFCPVTPKPAPRGPTTVDYT